MAGPLAPIAGNAAHDEKREKAYPIKPERFATKNWTEFSLNETINVPFNLLLLSE